MKRFSVFFLMFALILPISASAQDRDGKEGKDKGSDTRPAQPAKPAGRSAGNCSVNSPITSRW